MYKGFIRGSSRKDSKIIEFLQSKGALETSFDGQGDYQRHYYIREKTSTIDYLFETPEGCYDAQQEFEQWLKESEKPKPIKYYNSEGKELTKFEVGKWYCFPKRAGMFGKISSAVVVSGMKYSFTDIRFEDKGKLYLNHTMANNDLEIGAYEIPDPTVKTPYVSPLEREGFKIGDYLVLKACYNEFILIISDFGIEADPTRARHSFCIEKNNKDGMQENGSFCHISSYASDRTCRIATEEEKDWLDYCIEQGKYCSLEDFKKAKVIETPKEFYVICTYANQAANKAFIKNKCYKASKHSNNPEFFVLEEDSELPNIYRKGESKSFDSAGFKFRIADGHDLHVSRTFVEPLQGLQPKPDVYDGRDRAAYIREECGMPKLDEYGKSWFDSHFRMKWNVITEPRPYQKITLQDLEQIYGGEELFPGITKPKLPKISAKYDTQSYQAKLDACSSITDSLKTIQQFKKISIPTTTVKNF